MSQGQAKVFTLLDGLDSVPEDAEVFVVLEGSTLAHVTRGHNDVMLYFIVPGMCVCVCVRAREHTYEPISVCVSACFVFCVSCN